MPLPSASRELSPRRRRPRQHFAPRYRNFIAVEQHRSLALCLPNVQRDSGPAFLWRPLAGDDEKGLAGVTKKGRPV